MKIIFSVYDDISNPFYGGGGAIAIQEIAKRLSKKHEILIINSKHPNSKQNQLVDGVMYKRIGIGFFGPKIDQILFSLFLPFYVVSQKYDVWIESFLPPFSGSFLPLITKKPVIGLAYFLNADMMQKKYHLPFKFLEVFLLKNYKYIIALSESLQKKIVSVNQQANVSMIPLGVADTYFSTQHKEIKSKFILFLGRLDTYNKGLDMLFPMMIKILQENPEFQFIVAGTGIQQETEHLKDIIRKSGLGNRIILKGKVSEEEKIRLLSECMLYAFPSRYETFGISMLEALSVGTPSIIFDIPGFEWVPNTCAVKVKAFHQNEFYENLQILIRDSKKRQLLSENSKKFAKQFDWKTVETKYEKFIQEVSKGKSEINFDFEKKV